MSRGTVRRALLEGARRGLFGTVEGRGIFVTPRAIYAALAKVAPFPEAVRKMGGTPAMRFLSSSQITADPITARADQALEVSQADEKLAKLLGVVPGPRIFLVSSVASDEAGKPIGLRRTVCRGDRYRFFVRRAIDRDAV